MNWDAIGAIGEIISALAVLITLVYLARQIKHSANTNEAGISSSSLDAYHNWRCLVIDHAEVLARFENGETLSDSESLIVLNIAGDFAFASAANFSSATLYDLDRVKNFVDLMVLQLESSRVARETWPGTKLALVTSGFDDFVSEVEAARAAIVS